jgi:hypothetical protein
MTITIVYEDGSEYTHCVKRTFDAMVKARNYAFQSTVKKVLLNGRRVWV